MKNGTVLTNRSRNGMTVNPVGALNAFDSYTDPTSTNYTSANDIDPGSTGAAYTFAPGQTLVKTKSITTPNIYARPSVERFVVGTIVDTIPRAGAFRPPIPGDFKAIPASWREDQINWAGVPALAFNSFSASNVSWNSLATDMLETWQTWTISGNGSRSFTPSVLPGPYRQEIGDRIGQAIQALATEADQATKRDVMVGLIQLGIDQCAGAIHYDGVDTSNSSESSRFDIGRRAASVMSALMLPENDYLMTGLSNHCRWQDTSSHGIVDASIIALTDDDTEPGMALGNEGHP